MHAIVGVFKLVDVVSVGDVASHVDAAAQRWAIGPWCWILANPRKIEPVAWKGEPGLFSVPAVVVE